MRIISAILSLIALPVLAAPPEVEGYDVLFLGERHDNPHHHERQAEWVAQVQPTALVFEMLTASQASRVNPGIRNNEGELEAALGWQDSGWPDFSMYYPIFAAAPQAKIYGAAVPRATAQKAMTDGIAQSFGPDASTYNLTVQLSEDQQAEREAMQARAHCGMLPDTLLPTMVSIQRLRDAQLARTAVSAFEDTGGPVVVITGNGHARLDWGAPFILSKAVPNLRVFSLGQGETQSDPVGGFDMVTTSPRIERDDPCKAFHSN